MPSGEHRFGGSWTEEKLERVAAYLRAYTTAMKDRFRTVYIDAFAGTGSRTASPDQGMNPLFEVPEIKHVTDGSARKALQIEPPFAEYIFIEKNRKKIEALEHEVTNHPEIRRQITFLRGDANEELVKLCRSRSWNLQRAVLFLDPYGMQVNWKTLEAVAATRAMDVWYLVPVGIGIMRMLPHHGRIDPSWQARLDEMLGDCGWRERRRTWRSRNSRPPASRRPGIARYVVPQ